MPIVNDGSNSIIRPKDNAVSVIKEVTQVVQKQPDSDGDFWGYANRFIDGMNNAIKGAKELVQTYREIKGVQLAPGVTDPTKGQIQPAPAPVAPIEPQKPPEKSNKKMTEMMDNLKKSFINHVANCAAVKPDMKLSEILDTFPNSEHPLTAKGIVDLINAYTLLGGKL